MQLNLFRKINQDPKQKQFLRENSYWYKYLNRTNISYKYFIEDMKHKYKLTNTDKLNRLINNINTISSFLDVLK